MRLEQCGQVLAGEEEFIHPTTGVFPDRGYLK